MGSQLASSRSRLCRMRGPPEGGTWNRRGKQKFLLLGQAIRLSLFHLPILSGCYTYFMTSKNFALRLRIRAAEAIGKHESASARGTFQARASRRRTRLMNGLPLEFILSFRLRTGITSPSRPPNGKRESKGKELFSFDLIHFSFALQVLRRSRSKSDFLLKSGAKRSCEECVFPFRVLGVTGQQCVGSKLKSASAAVSTSEIIGPFSAVRAAIRSAISESEDEN